MANPEFYNDTSMAITYLVNWFQENLLHLIGLMQLGAIGVSYLIAWLFAAKIRQHLEKDFEKVKAHMRFVLGPVHFTIVLKYVFWLVLVWFFQVLFKKLTMPTELSLVTLTLILALLIIRFASFYIKSAFWARFV